jgi:PAS domain S-box-containing protein
VNRADVYPVSNTTVPPPPPERDGRPPGDRPERPFERVVLAVVPYAMVLLDREGRVTSWNDGARLMLGYERDEVLGQPSARFYSREALERHEPATAFREALEAGYYANESWRVRKDGTRFWADSVLTALFGPERTLTGFVEVIRDLSSRQHVHDQLRDSEQRFRLLIDAVRDYAIFLLDVDGYVISWNPGAERIKGYRAAEILGSHFSRFYPPDAVARHWPEYELEQARLNGRFEDEGWRIRKDGSRFWANVVISALHDNAGVHKGFVKITRDLTERRRAEESLRAAHADLEVRVRERTRELAETNATLRSEVAARKRLESELRATVNQLEEMDQSKNRFLAVLAHELRNPLAPIRNAVELMKLQPAFGEYGVQSRDVIDRQVSHMTRLIDDLLDLSRIIHNGLKLQRQHVPLRSVVDASIETSRPLFDARQQQLTVGLPEEPITVDTDPVRLAQVFSNLLNNASKFTPEHGRVNFTLEREDRDVVARIVDTGIGIPPDQISHAFEMFAQVEPERDRAKGGLGIGLALAKRFVELHGGTIDLFSVGRGQGTTVTVRLPIGVVAEAALMSPERSAAGRAQRKLNVLIADDNTDSAETLRLLLQFFGHDVRVAFDGAEAVRLATEARSDVALLDIGMPIMNGYDAARAIRRLPDTAGIVLVAMTGWGQEGDKLRAQEAGFDLHLTKPVNPEKLQKILDRTQADVDSRRNRT